jgi:hypothetical protein
MNKTTVGEVKRYLGLDSGEQDALLAVFLASAEHTVEKVLRMPLDDIAPACRQAGEIAKAAGSEQSVLFKVNFNPRLRAGLHLDFNLPDGRQAGTFVIESIDGYEFYQRDLTLRATRIKQEDYDYEEYDEN